MDLNADYYPFYEVNGKNADLIFRELNTNEFYRNIQDGSWIEAFINRFGQMLEDTPNVRATANRILHEGLLKRGFNIDPEKVHVNTFGGYEVVDHKGVYHTHDSLKESYRLTDAALMNFFVENYNDRWDILGTYKDIGVYTVGKEGKFDPTEPLFGRGWGPNSHVCVAKEPADVLYNSDIQASYTADFEAFWNKYSDLYREMAGDLFIAAAIRQYKNGLLSEYGFAMIRKVYAQQPGVDTYWFNIDRYEASDIIVLVGKVSGRDHTILYITGASSPFIEFDNFTQMRRWLIKQLANPVAMNAFKKHFSVYDRQDGTSYSGVDTFLTKMVKGVWNPQDYIMLRPRKLPYDSIFAEMRDQMKRIMEDDASRQINSNSEFYRHYILGFVENMLSQVAIFDIVAPEIAIPLDLALSSTAVGLSADIVINGDTYQERLNGIGPLVVSTIYTVTNLLPVFRMVGSILKSFTRPASQIAAFADEEMFMMRKFNIDTVEELQSIKAGDRPHVFIGPEGEMRLVRLKDGTKQLVVIRKVGGNKYIRLNPTTFEEVRGEGFISEVLEEPDSISKKVVYLTNSRLSGGAPYNPYEYFFDEVWTVEEFKAKADKLGTNDATYVSIQERLRAMHDSRDLFTRLNAAHETLYLIDEYKKVAQAFLRKRVVVQLSEQIKNTLYSPEVAFLKRRLLEPYKPKNPLVVTHIYRTSLGEQLGELPQDITYSLVKFAEGDDILANAAMTTATETEIPAHIPFEPKYVIEDLPELNALTEDFTKLPEYEGKDLATNEAVFLYALDKSHGQGLLSKCIPSGNGKKLFIGHSYAELVSITDYASNTASKLGPHSGIVVKMIQSLLKGGGEGRMMQRYGRKSFLNRTIARRLTSAEDIIHYYDSTVFERYDSRVKEVFETTFNQLPTEAERLNLMMTNRNGILLYEGSEEITFCLNNLDFFKSKGVTHIGLSCFFADLHQPEINMFLRGSNLTPELEAIMLSTDKGVEEGPLYQLLLAAREKDLEVVALGQSDGGRFTGRSVFTQAYNKGTAVRNAEHLLRGKKSIVVSDLHLANTSPGLLNPSPGLSQTLEMPAFKSAQSGGKLEFWPDQITNRGAVYIRLSRDWLELAPKEGHFLGWKKYGDNFTFVTPTQREASVFSNVEGNLEQFKEEFSEVQNIATGHQSAQSRSCDRVTVAVRNALSNHGKRVGKGYSLSWWMRDREFIGNNVHTAPSVFIGEEEFVVDASHLQFPHAEADEGVMILPPEEWAEEILNRAHAYNAYQLNRSLFGSMLWAFRGPEFTRPKQVDKSN